MSLQLQRALESLYGLERKRETLGVEGTERLLGALGHPQRRFNAIHVGGTNGKGSIAALIERVLRAAGIRSGLFTSPHLVDFRERIRVSGAWADEERLARRLERVQSLPESRERSFFEVATALGFDHFAGERVEWAVVEVGLGGRLDCTNVVDPAVSVIGEVGLDHTEILGATLPRIAAEKAGIVKPGVPVVSGATARAAAAVIRRTARARGAPLVPARRRVAVSRSCFAPAGFAFRAAADPWGALELEVPLRGRHQLANAVVALAALSVLAEREPRIDAAAVRDGFAHVRWPGRLEPCPARPRLWWDGAHNLDGVRALARAWIEDLRFEPPEALVLATSRDKDVRPMLAALRELAPGARRIVTRSRNPRALAPEALRDAAAELGWPAEIAPDVPAALDRALGAGRGRVLLLGSLFAVGEAMEALGGAPGELQ